MENPEPKSPVKYPYKRVPLRVKNSSMPKGTIRIGRPNPQQQEIRRDPVAPNYAPASPGVDGVHNWGGLTSGASTSGFATIEGGQPAPTDWKSSAPEWGHPSGGGAGSIFPSAPSADALRNRKRGVSPFGGYYGSSSGRSVNVTVESGSGKKAESVLKPGGIADLNPGADGSIAGGYLGHMQASTLVRLHGVRADRNMRLPVTPDAATRSGNVMRPAGGGADAGPMAPLSPQMPGLPSIFGVFTSGSKAPQKNPAHVPGCADRD